MVYYILLDCFLSFKEMVYFFYQERNVDIMDVYFCNLYFDLFYMFVKINIVKLLKIYSDIIEIKVIS